MPIKVIDLQSEDAPTDDDLIIIRDNLTGTTRKVTRARFFENPPIANGAITNAMIADGSITKAKLGEDAKISVRLLSQISPGTLTPNVNDYDIFAVTGLNSSMTIAAPTGSPVDGQGIMFRIRDNGGARGLTWNGIYRAVGVTIPGATVANRMLYVAARWNAPHSVWDVLSVGRE